MGRILLELVIIIVAVVVVVGGLGLMVRYATGYDPEKEREESRRRKLEEAKREEEGRQRQNTEIIARFGRLVTYEEYVAGTTCIGLSPYCKGRKSRSAIVCNNCYLAQGFDRPIGFAQSGGGATKDELGQMVVARLGYHRVGPGQWQRD